MQGWMSIVRSLATIAFILMAFGLMLGIVKPTDALNCIGAILGAVIALIFIPGILVTAWSGMALWEKISLVAIEVSFSQWRKSRR
jgi:hypothetical protein